MRTIKQTVEVIKCPPHPLNEIIRAASTCYKYGPLLPPKIARKLVERYLVHGNHLALQFVEVVVKFTTTDATYTLASRRFRGLTGVPWASQRTPDMIEPSWWPTATPEQRLIWEQSNALALASFEALSAGGVPAHELLPSGRRVDMVLSGSLYAWREVFFRHAHESPQSQILIGQLLATLKQAVPVVFDKFVSDGTRWVEVPGAIRGLTFREEGPL